MSQPSPTLEGFRAAFRMPSVTVAEVAWRWAVGAAATASLFFVISEYLRSLPVNKLDAAFLKTRKPLLVERAIAHIFQGTLNRAAVAALLAASALAVLWIVASSAGRMATVSALLEYFQTHFTSRVSPATSRRFAEVRGLVGLNFYRIVVTVAVGLAIVASAMIAGLESSRSIPHPGLSMFIFMLIGGLTCVLWGELNWFLSLASIFVVSNREDSFGAVSATVNMMRREAGSVFAVSAWNAIAHLTAFAGASSFFFGLLLFVHIVPAPLIITGELLVSLVYFAVIDWLYIARLGGYIFIRQSLDWLSSPLVSAIPLLPHETGKRDVSVGESAVDRDEAILSDLPGLTPEF